MRGPGESAHRVGHAPDGGAPVSMRMPSSVLMRHNPSAPASLARPGDRDDVGDVGRELDDTPAWSSPAFTARVTSAAAFGRRAETDMPPCRTLGQRDVHLDQPHLLLAVDPLAAIRRTPRPRSPPILAMTGLWKIRSSCCGSSSAMTRVDAGILQAPRR